MTMTSYQSVDTPVGFAEGTVLRVEKTSSKVVVIVRAWNESTVEVEFDDAVGFREAMSHELSDLVVSECTGDFSSWCMSRAYDGGRNGGESLFQFLDVDGLASIEIVAKNVQIRIA